MTIKEKINQDIKDAMRAKDKKRLDALRLISAAIKQIEVDERIEVTDQRLLSILDKLLKQRKESISQFTQANRTDLVEKEQFEADLITSYLPPPLSEDEILQLINTTITKHNASKISDMAKIMTELKPTLQGRADMAKVSNLIKSKLST